MQKRYTRSSGQCLQVCKNSLLLDSSLSQYLSRTPSVAGNRKKFVISAWLKLGKLSVTAELLSAQRTAGTDGARCYISGGTSALQFYAYNGSTYDYNYVTSRLFRDTSALTHIYVAYDSDNAVAADRIQIWINGVRETSFTTATAPSLGFQSYINQAIIHKIGSDPTAGVFSDCVFSDYYFVNDSLPPAASFGYKCPQTNQWLPKPYSGSYGTNGFHLKFENAAALGEDSSGNGNNWTLNGGIVAANQLTDVPGNNYATLNPLIKAGIALSKGNLNAATTSADSNTFATMPTGKTGKWYAEFKVSSVSSVWPWVGTRREDSQLGGDTSVFYPGVQSGGEAGYLNNGNKYVAGIQSAYGNTFIANDTIGIAVDCDNGAVYFSKNGVWQGGGDPTSGASKTGAAAVWAASFQSFFVGVAVNSGASGLINFGQRPFTYTPPTGFKALCTRNLPTPAILKPEQHHNVYTVTKSGDTNFTLDWDATVYDTLFVIKQRNGTTEWKWVDGLRGYDKVLSSNTTNAEATDANVIGVSGTTITLKSTLPDGTYVVEAWKAGLASARSSGGGTGGASSVVVSANPTSGFSIVTYATSGAIGTVPHGTGRPLKFLTAKSRNLAAGHAVWHTGLAGNDYYLYLNTTDAQSNAGASHWNNTAPTSNDFSIGAWFSAGYTWVSYCHAEVPGYSEFGSYTGNASADGPFTYTGFTSRSVVEKRVDAAYDWWNQTSTVWPTNPVGLGLAFNLADAEYTSAQLDIVSNGCKLRAASAGLNAGTIIYAAWASTPFKNANAR